MPHPRSSSLSAARLSRRRAVQLALAGAALASQVPQLARAQTPAAPSPTSADTSGLVSIGSRRLWREIFGNGSPTVILVGGYRCDGDFWDTVALAPQTNGPAVLPGVAAFTRVVAYDRPGTFLDPATFQSRSDPVPMLPQPRTALELMAELHTLLGAAQVPPPYVLVGHSLGGVIVRLYASAYPTEVVGMVQVDPFNEDVWARLQAVLTPEQWAAFDALDRTVTPQLLQVYPEVEIVDLTASAAEMRAVKAKTPLQPMPLVVIEHGIPASLGPAADFLPADFPWDTFEQAQTAAFRALAASVPGGRFVVAEHSGHNIMVDQPDLVIDQIRQVVAAVHDPSTWRT